jgi:hypothetical protein
MSDWLHNLPVPLMALAIFGLTYLLAAAIFAVVLAEALQLVVSMTPQGAGQQTAQREIIAALRPRWMRAGNGSSSARPKSIRSNGGACICRRSASCW